jgi:hypothetical protein
MLTWIQNVALRDDFQINLLAGAVVLAFEAAIFYGIVTYISNKRLAKIRTPALHNVANKLFLLHRSIFFFALSILKSDQTSAENVGKIRNYLNAIERQFADLKRAFDASVFIFDEKMSGNFTNYILLAGRAADNIIFFCQTIDKSAQERDFVGRDPFSEFFQMHEIFVKLRKLIQENNFSAKDFSLKPEDIKIQWLHYSESHPNVKFSTDGYKPSGSPTLLIIDADLLRKIATEGVINTVGVYERRYS